MIGKSTHNEKQLARALGEQPDYVAIGPVFETQSKLNPSPTLGLGRVRRLRARCAIPTVAIGGINEDNLRTLLRAGFTTYALIGHVGGSRQPGAAIRRLKSIEDTMIMHDG